MYSQGIVCVLFIVVVLVAPSLSCDNLLISSAISPNFCRPRPGQIMSINSTDECSEINNNFGMAGPTYMDNNAVCDQFLTGLSTACKAALQNMLCSMACAACGSNTTWEDTVLPCKTVCNAPSKVCPPESAWPQDTTAFCTYLMGFVAPSPDTCAPTDTDCSNVPGYISVNEESDLEKNSEIELAKYEREH